jgi:hypothetical protein
MKKATKEIMQDARTLVLDSQTVMFLGKKYAALKFSKSEKEHMVSEIRELLNLGEPDYSLTIVVVTCFIFLFALIGLVFYI